MTKKVAKQALTRRVSLASIMKDPAFADGVEDVRKGRPARFDHYPLGQAWEYERGRQWAMIAPMSMPLFIGKKLNPKALELFRLAVEIR